MARMIHVPCPRCGGCGFVPNSPIDVEDCPRCHGRGYIYQRPEVWRCAMCNATTQGRERCGKCRTPREFTRRMER